MSLFRCISPAEAKQLLTGKNVTLFDIHDLKSFQQGAIAGAIHLGEGQLAKWLTTLDKMKPVVIYCYHGNASKTFASMFSDFKFQRVYSVEGGYEQFAKAFADPIPSDTSVLH